MNPVPDPAPWPEGKEWETKQGLYLPITAPGWRKDLSFECGGCGEHVFLHPNTNKIWGCKKCGITTASPGIYFREAARVS